MRNYGILFINYYYLLTICLVATVESMVAQMPEPMFWLRADKGTLNNSAPANDGEQINTWVDFSGNRRNNAFNDEGKGPIFKNNAVDNINFNPVLDFNGSDQSLHFGDDEIFNPAVQEALYWFVIVKPDITSLNKLYPMVFSYGSASAKGIGLGIGSEWISNLVPNKNSNGTFTKAFQYDQNPKLILYELIFDDEFNIRINSYYTPFNSSKIRLNEISMDSIAHSSVAGTNVGPFSIGRQSNNNSIHVNDGRFFDGKLCEIIGVNSLLTDSQIVQIESYLNIKYGIERNVYNTRLTGKYLSSAGHVLWDPMKDLNFNNHIIGIGCDTSLHFIQESSHSLAGQYELQISNEDSNGFDMTNNYVQYLMAGSNGESSNTFQNAPAGSDDRFNQRIRRAWKIINTEFYGVFDIVFESDADLPEGKSWYLLISDNEEFTNPTIYEDEVFRVGDSLIISEISSNQIPIGSTKFVAVAYGNPAMDTLPEEDPNSLHNILWLRSDVGVNSATKPSKDGENVTSWEDQSGKRKNDAEYARIIGPTFRSQSNDLVNYHPVLDFNGTSQSLNFGDDFIFIDSVFKEVNFFVVAEPDAASVIKNNQNIFDFGEAVPLGFGLKYGNSNSFIYTSTNGGGVNIGTDHSFDTQPVLLHLNVVFGNEQQLFINGAKTPILKANIQLKELNEQTMAVNEVSIETEGPFTIGSQSKLFWINKNDKRYYDGSILEIIGYKSTMSDIEIIQVESYLAHKYGITKICEDGDSNGDYVLTNGDLVWDASKNIEFQHDIIGIGRDDSVKLYQKQAQSIDGKMRIYFGNSIFNSNAENSHVFGDDFKSVLVGHNNGALLSEGTNEFPQNVEIFSRVEREWKLHNNRFYSTFSIDIELPTDSLSANHLRLLVDTDDDFLDATLVTCNVLVTDNWVTFQGMDNSIFPVNKTSYFTIVSMNELTPLPVSLLSFEAILEEDVVVLEWVTESEINNDRFEVHKSTDGRSWNRIDQVSGAGNSRIKQYYQSWDYDLFEGTAYYKLIQVDFDGKSEEFGPVTITYDGMQKNIKVFPNPFDTDFTIDLGTEISEEVTVKLFDVSGKLYYSNSLIPQFGTIKVFPDNLKLGVYLLNVQSSRFNHSEKMLYQPKFSSSIQSDLIKQAIVELEKKTSSEFSFVSSKKIDNDNTKKQLFDRLGMYKTQQRNAVMLMWNEGTDSLSFVADKRIYDSEVNKELQQVLEKFENNSTIDNKVSSSDIVEVVQAFGTVLENHFKASDRNINEIPDYVISW